MKKKITIAVIALIIIMISAALIAKVSLENNLQVSISYPTQQENSSYIGTILFGGISDFLPNSKKDHIKEVSDDMVNFYLEFKKEQEEPYYVKVNYENTDGKTVITYSGKVTDKQTKKLVDFNKVFSYDFYITDNINITSSEELKP